MDIDEVFERVSSFWTKDGKIFEKKTCDFIINMIDEDTNDSSQKIGEVKDYDMSSFVKKNDIETTILFAGAKFESTELTVKWTIQPAKETKS